MPTRIAFCITELDPGGAERALVRLVLGLDRSEWEPRVFCLQGPGELADELIRAGVSVQSLNLRSSWQLPGALRRLTRHLREFRPAILQTWLWHANILGRLAGRLAGVPHIVSGIRVADHSRPWRLRIDRWTAGLVERHVCVSQGVAEFSATVGGLVKDSLIVIPNGVEVERFATTPPADLAEFGIPPLSPTVVFVGRLDPQKDPLAFVEVARRLSQVYSDLQFLMVGAGPMHHDVERAIAAFELRSRVHLAGWRSDVPAILRAAWCFVLTSRWEGMANVVLEAMAAGLPIVATDVEGVREVVTPHQTGVIVQPGDPEGMTAAVALLAGDPAGARRLGDAAQDFVRKNFTWNRFLASHVELYREVLSPV